MNHNRIVLALFGTLSLLASVDLASAKSTEFEGSREWLRDQCSIVDGEIVEGRGKTTCMTVAGLEIVCRQNNQCSRTDEIASKQPEVPASLSTGGTSFTVKKNPLDSL